MESTSGCSVSGPNALLYTSTLLTRIKYSFAIIVWFLLQNYIKFRNYNVHKRRNHNRGRKSRNLYKCSKIEKVYLCKGFAKSGCTSAIQASSIAFGLHWHCRRILKHKTTAIWKRHFYPECCWRSLACWHRSHKKVSISFLMSATEVSQQEYESVMGSNPSECKGSSLPVENVTWYDAVAYCNALSQREDPAKIIKYIEHYQIHWALVKRT